MAISFSPFATYTATGTFGVQSQGYIQGTAIPNPAYRTKLASGVVSSTSSVPLYGGYAVTESLPATTNTANSLLGNVIAPAATTGANIQAFVVFNQAHNGVISTGNDVPLYDKNTTVNYYRVGSGAEIILKIDPTFAATLLSGTVSPELYWDFTNQQLVGSGTGALKFTLASSGIQIGNSKTITYSSGAASWSSTGSVARVII